MTVMDILRVLNKSNCRECGVPTCMAFAAMVTQGQKELSACPYIDEETAARLGGAVASKKKSIEEERDEYIRNLQKEIRNVDFHEAAKRCDASVTSSGNLAIYCLGKIFELNQQGKLDSLCHVNAWVHLPIINYVVRSAGQGMTGEWVIFKQLKGAQDWVRFFEHRCERQIKLIADKDPDLFIDSLDLFCVDNDEESLKDMSSADHLFTLYPLPKVPMVIAYWKAEDEFESKLNLFFDRSAEVNLGADSIYFLAMGMVEMLKKIVVRHGPDRNV